MEITRDSLLSLDNHRKSMEDEIIKITDFLTSPGMPGVTGPLIDREGFPIQGIDHTMIRTERNKLIRLQNDLKGLMLQIEKDMQTFFLKEKDKIRPIANDIVVDKKEPISIQLFEEDNFKNNDKLKLPFAVVGLVSEGSPAEESGLKPGDSIINFDNIISYGITNPLQKIAEIVRNKENKPIRVEIMRKTNPEIEFEQLEVLDIVLTPHKWFGLGLLGCKLNLI